MASYSYGKAEVCDWIRKNIPATARILDVGACDGVWRRMLPGYSMDAVEIYAPNVERLSGYGRVINADIFDFHYDFYDLVIFGDVIEHMTVAKAQQVLYYAKCHSGTVIVAVPFLYEQGAIYGNPFEVHIQDDLTAELFELRYPGFRILFDTEQNYCYYLWRAKT